MTVACSAIKVIGAGELTVNDGTITGETAISSSSTGGVTINGGTITGGKEIKKHTSLCHICLFRQPDN